MAKTKSWYKAKAECIPWSVASAEGNVSARQSAKNQEYRLQKETKIEKKMNKKWNGDLCLYGQTFLTNPVFYFL